MNNAKIGSILQNSIKPLSPDDTVKTALNIMHKYAISSVIIVDETHHPIGIFTERDSLKIIADDIQSTAMLADVMKGNVFSITENYYIHDAYVLMQERKYRHLVIVDDNKVYKGVVTEGDFLRHMGFEDVVEGKNINQAMSEFILTVEAETSIIATAKLMSQKRCDYAIVLQSKKPSAIITERDITLYCANHTIDNETSISSIFNDNVYSINKDLPLSEASNLMKQHSIHQLVVLNDKKELVGLITRHDILKAIHGAYFEFLLKTIEEKTKKEIQLNEQTIALEKLANFDILTGLPNRLLFTKLLKKSIAHTLINKNCVALIILDIDRFKDINDNYGPAIGDELLKSLSQRLIKHIKKGDYIARLGGNEFALILEDVQDEQHIPKVIKNILNKIAEPINLSNATTVSVKSCAGAVILPKDTKDVNLAIQYANSALHQAKQNGHGMYQFYTDEFLLKSLQKIAYENALRLAIKNNELELYYQPQVHMKTNKIISAEALLRWTTKDGQIIPPSVFIPIADETGLINEIGEWVLFEACRQGKIFLELGHNITIAVNVSANQVKYQDLPSLISKALNKYNFDPHKLEIEITESALMQREEDVVEMLYALRAKGIRLAIDDFGTGYSSLSYLKRFPIDVLKIDKIFIDDIPYDNDDCAIVTAIIEMGKALGYHVLAEGTEKQEQLDFLKDKDCTVYQGYIKSKPLPAKEFLELLESEKD